jgi:outer membrane protein, heavy metal efflux system
LPVSIHPPPGWAATRNMNVLNAGARICVSAAILANFFAPGVRGQQVFTWDQIRQRFEQSNPTLRAAQMNVDEARASEITAYLRPNPDFTATVDQLDPITPNPYRPLANTLPLISSNYLHERAGKRELRRDSARQATSIAEVNVIDTERTLLFTLRNAFVQALQAKAILQLANENLAYYDNLLGLNRERYRAGDIAQIDVERLELQRVQYLTDVTNSTVAVRTAKIQLLQLLNDRTPVEQFDIAGPFDFNDRMQPLEELRNIALEARPDLKAALRTVEKAQTDHKLAVANGSVDPTFGVDIGRNPPISAYFGFNVTIPLRIFDRNQGEKARTEIDIQRSERLRDATQAQVFSDVDSAYTTLMGTLNLLRPYKATYLAQADRIRETVSFMYERGAASLLDFLNAQNDYRTTQLNYRNLLGSYLTAANQLNLAVGREVVQ